MENVVIKLIGLFAGLAIGTIPIASASWVWGKHQILKLGGSFLMGGGAIIIVIALAAFGDWQFVKVVSKAGDWELILKKQAKRIKALESQVASLAIDQTRLIAAMRETALTGKATAALARLPSAGTYEQKIWQDVTSYDALKDKYSKSTGRVDELREALDELALTSVASYVLVNNRADPERLRQIFQPHERYPKEFIKSLIGLDSEALLKKLRDSKATIDLIAAAKNIPKTGTPPNK